MKSLPTTLLVSLFLAGNPAPAEAFDSPPAALRWNVTLRDGSRLAGVPHVGDLRLEGAVISEARIAPAGIVSLRLDADQESVTILGTGGERISGVVLNETLALETGLGRFELPFGEVLSIGTGDFVDAPLPGDGFPSDDRVVDFETDPAGRRLTVGEDVSATFVPWGLRIATSVATSFPAVDGFVVSSKSQGFSCATQSPRWNGTLTLSFCRPGRPDVPATVTRCGLWVASVAPNGTTLRALDADGAVLAEATTTLNGSEFLAVRSNRPIARVQVIPNPNVDPNYTIDDVVFDAPRSLGAPGEEGTYAVTFATGDVLEARDIDLDAGYLVLSGLSIGADRLRVSRSKVVTIRFPTPSS